MENKKVLETLKTAGKIVGKTVYENGKNLMITGLFAVASGYCAYKAKNTAQKTQQEISKDAKAAYRTLKEFTKNRLNNEE